MGLLCKMLDDAIIKKNLEGVNNLLLLVCPGCACESLSYERGVPDRLNSGSTDPKETAVAVKVERDRWLKIFEEININTEHHMISSPCSISEAERKIILEGSVGKDAVAILSCASGFIGIKNILKEYPGKLVPMMRTIGTTSFNIVVYEKDNRYTIVDRDSAYIVNFKGNH